MTISTTADKSGEHVGIRKEVVAAMHPGATYCSGLLGAIIYHLPRIMFSTWVYLWPLLVLRMESCAIRLSVHMSLINAGAQIQNTQ
jgi:hypothetical protein